MKKTLYTISFLALFSVAASAQVQVLSTPNQSTLGTLQQEPSKAKDASIQQEPTKKGAEAKDPTSAKKEAAPAAPASSSSSSESKKATRMAINEKGVPASKETKSTSTAADKSTKAQKTANPGQPTTTSDNK